jgi:hypothetical protein
VIQLAENGATMWCIQAYEKIMTKHPPKKKLTETAEGGQNFTKVRKVATTCMCFAWILQGGRRHSLMKEKMCHLQTLKPEYNNIESRNWSRCITGRSEIPKKTRFWTILVRCTWFLGGRGTTWEK